jgi:hypothetical protein
VSGQLPDTLQPVPVDWEMCSRGSGSTMLMRLSVTNTDESEEITLSVRDGIPVYWLKYFKIPPGANVELHPALRFRNGVFWKASGPGLTGGMVLTNGGLP